MWIDASWRPLNDRADGLISLRMRKLRQEHTHDILRLRYTDVQRPRALGFKDYEHDQSAVNRTDFMPTILGIYLSYPD